MLFQLLLIILGIVLLIKGADWLVEGASALARRNKVSNLAIGLTIVAFGTSAPELVVNSFASLENHPDLVLGNVIGSNNFNLFAILGIVGLITPLVVQSSTVWREIPLSLLAVLVVYLLGNILFYSGQLLIDYLDAGILLVLFTGFLFYVFRQLKEDPATTEKKFSELSTPKMWLFIITGLAGLVIGGRIVIVNAVDLAKAMGIGEKIIGLTILAAGTSLPELATSVTAALKRNNDIAVGNVIGSNIFNLFFILPVSALVRPIVYNPKFNTELYLLAAGTVFLLFAMFSGQKKKLDRWEAGILLFSFLAYTIYLVTAEL